MNSVKDPTKMWFFYNASFKFWNFNKWGIVKDFKSRNGWEMEWGIIPTKARNVEAEEEDAEEDEDRR